MQTLIIGATGGIGHATSQAFAAQQAQLTLTGRNEEKLQALGQELRAKTKVTDLSYESHIKALFEETEPLDTLVYAAGSAHPELLKLADPAKVRAVWNANYFGVLWTLKYGLKKMAKGGRIYIVGARPELVTYRSFSQYAASKAAMQRAAEIARLEARNLDICVVLPPAVDTGLWEQVGKVPKGAIEPKKVAEAIVQDRGGDAVEELRVE